MERRKRKEGMEGEAELDRRDLNSTAASHKNGGSAEIGGSGLATLLGNQS